MSKGKLDLTLLFMLVGSLSFNVYLFSRTEHAAPPPKKYNSLALSGRDAPSIAVTTLTGVGHTIHPEGKPPILYVLTPGCSFCDANAENMRAIAKQLGTSYRIVGLSLQRAGLAEYLNEFPLPFEVFAVTNYRDPALAPYGFGATPAMYVIERGKIRRAWGGLLTGATQTDVETVFSISLPGAPDF
jgi:hypothetical protein